MKGMLEMDPDERYTALECLGDPYFDGLREPEIEKLARGLNNNAMNQSSTSQIRQEASKSRSSMRSNTVERESISNGVAKNKT
jgi:serine/threonine protein kinase